ncbi:adenine phosphoribosyltransferase [Mesoplasma lactucae]|uniref:Adenine phosphoribosyltransferase n=1 Tax=Mesoplasma lactucae ATCC 49193 TaxID=81460 RepID=A0A291IRP7_9MOLU|nr:adenine phosphoribosyltransferase [Mesoplasma lactucae]ATG97361.1 adenine phosphoribosyltransferase [Mesoplasma lactucae ATCC 49193]ATZ20187.1 adenine phosphoribosyltransferase [Mesoplasma lactucae ATCC 49193]MCL8216936.1 Adenine phosphoribosyltransferase [Mesoplasma lactucae ATCC 49193]
MDFKKYITDVPNFPKEGVVFKDITTLLNDPEAFKAVIDEMSQFVKEQGATAIVAPEARGFVFASAIAYVTGTKFVLVRKPGKLPRKTNEVEYTLEYGTSKLQMQQGDLTPNDKVVIVDDILATGGTIDAIIELIDKEHAEIVGIEFLADITELHDKELEKKYKVKSLINY